MVRPPPAINFITRRIRDSQSPYSCQTQQTSISMMLFSQNSLIYFHSPLDLICFYKLGMFMSKTTITPLRRNIKATMVRKQFLAFMSRLYFSKCNRKAGSNESEQVAGLDNKCFLHVPWCGFPVLCS